MFPRPEFKLIRQALLVLLVSAALSQTAEATPAGSVVFATGDVSATSADGQVRRLQRGGEIAVGDTIVTGADGRAQVRFTDGAFSSFQPETRFRVDQYQYAGKVDGSEKSFFSLLKGALRTVTGVIGHANKKNYQVATPTATIGIRGTEYLAREGNSLNVSVGEGQIEVCNSAGCLVVADGESAFVKDTSTRPAFTQLKTEAGPPPPPPPPKPAEFSVSENRDSSGDSTIIPPPEVTPPPVVTPPLPSGPGYVGALAGYYKDTQSVPTLFLVPTVAASPGDATFNATGELLSYSTAYGTDTFSATAGVIAGGLTDGIIAWGRWDSGSATDSGSNFVGGPTAALQDVHYVIGQPTPAADIMALSTAANSVGTYSLLGFTYPTAIDSNGVRTVGNQPVTGSLTAWFGTGVVDVSLGVPIGGYKYDITGSNIYTVGTGTFTGLGSVSGIPYGVALINGLFAGANAARAGLVYQFDTTDAANPIGTVNGAAAFQQASMGLPPLQNGAGYISAMAGNYIDPTNGLTSFILPGDQLPGNATFSGAGGVLSYSAGVCMDGCGYTGNFSATAGLIAQRFTDGVIGWGRWDSGSVTDSSVIDCCGATRALQDVHYIVGQPTPAADMMALYSANAVGTYSLIGATFPTAIDSNGVRTIGTQPVMGSLTANFGGVYPAYPNVNVTLGVPIGGNTFSISGSASLCPTCTVTSSQPAAFNGSGTVSGGGITGGYANINGLFVGPGASRAGLVYQFDTTTATTPIGTVNGAAAFAKN